MSDTKAQQESSMEEILASIRRMISEEDPAHGRAASAEAARDPASDHDDVLELTEALDDPRPAAASPASAASLGPATEDEPVLSSASANAASAALARLSAAAPAAAAAKSLTVDDLVRELLRPMLKDWLDANLPQLVEQAVEREISRIASGAVRR